MSITRRKFLAKAAALGITMPALGAFSYTRAEEHVVEPPVDCVDFCFEVSGDICTEVECPTEDACEGYTFPTDQSCPGEEPDDDDDGPQCRELGDVCQNNPGEGNNCCSGLICDDAGIGNGECVTDTIGDDDDDDDDDGDDDDDDSDDDDGGDDDDDEEPDEEPDDEEPSPDLVVTPEDSGLIITTLPNTGTGSSL